MGPNGRVAQGNRVCLGIGGQGAFVQIHLTQEVGVGGRDHPKYTADALARRFRQLGLWKSGVLQFSSPAIQSGILRRTTAVVIDDRVTENAMEPGDNRSVGAQSAPSFESAEIRALENIFGNGVVADSPCQEREKTASLIEQ